mmetsp:Transcript_36619/g.105520  ORF Transcript_36619/g.105520 Transcript_36619/m.105520 type:complete len:226 (-) Transcript_36619:150-827(-)
MPHLASRVAWAAVLAAAPCAVAGVGADEILLADFASGGATEHTWQQMNDPVMGGRSTGTFHVEGNVGVFDGEVVDVPFLKAPGFIKASTNDAAPFRRAFPDISHCKAIAVEAKSANHYSGFFFSFGRAHPTEGKTFAFGYKAAFSPAVGEFGEAVIPLNSFTDYWDDATGQPIRRCADDAKYCPTGNALKDVRTISVWAEGTAGRVHLELKTVKAVGCEGTEIFL